MIQVPRICIETYKVRDIGETMKVVVDNKGYWVKIRESKVVLEVPEMMRQVEAVGMSKVTAEEDSSSEDFERRTQNGLDHDSELLVENMVDKIKTSKLEAQIHTDPISENSEGASHEGLIVNTEYTT